MSFFIYNDKFYEDGEKIISPENRSLKYGDGLFETMKMTNSKLLLKEYHFDRLLKGMDVLGFQKAGHFKSGFFEQKVMSVCLKNNLTSARIRIMVSRGTGSLYQFSNSPEYIIHAGELNVLEDDDKSAIDIFPDARKACDKFSNLKSNNFLPYVMAALYARNNNLNDCIVLNQYDRICDSTIANVFMVKDNIIYTPPLSEGCVAGVTRRWMLEKLKSPFTIIEKAITVNDLEQADEIFLTNAITNIREVNRFRNTELQNQVTKELRKYADVET